MKRIKRKSAFVSNLVIIVGLAGLSVLLYAYDYENYGMFFAILSFVFLTILPACSTKN